MKIEFFLDNIYRSQLFSLIKQDTPVAVQSAYIRTQDDGVIIEQVKQCISVLFHFEQLIQQEIAEKNAFSKSKELQEFRDNIHKWLRQLACYLLRVATVDDHRYLIFETIRCRHIGEWASDLIQITNVVDDSCVDFFIAVLSVFLTPITKAMSENSVPEYILLEDDYMQLWQQFPFFEVVDYLFVKARYVQYSTFSNWKASFSVLDTILYILQQSLSTFNIPTHRQFARQIGHTIVRYVQITTSVLLQHPEYELAFS